MTERIRRQLDDVFPQDTGMTDQLKQQILRQAQKRFGTEQERPHRKMIPLATGAAALVLSGALIYPFAGQLQNEHAFEQAVEKEVIRKAVIPDTSYPDLITSVYAEDNDEIIHAKENGIYAYSLVSGTDERLADIPSDTPFSSVTIKANARWLVWETDILHILDRQTGDHLGLESTLGTELLQDDQLFYIGDSADNNEETMAYFVRDLLSGEITKIHNLNGVSHSAPLVQDDLFVTAEQRERKDGVFTFLTVYDWRTGHRMKEIKLQATEAAEIQLDGNRIYGRFTDQEGRSAIGYVDLESGEYQTVPVEVKGNYAVHEEYLAISQPAAGTDTVLLHRLSSDRLEQIDVLDGAGERLVKPRFTRTGKLIVNGEGPEKPIYIIDTAKLPGQ